MSGLRTKQKAARERRILEAAVRMFRAEGYKSVRIEDLAEAAEVSAGTVYNYYRTKGDILIAVVALEVEEVLAAGARVVTNPPNGAEVAILKLIFGYFDHSLEYLSKDMWRLAMALSIEAPDTPNGHRYRDLDQRLSDQVTELIATLQGRNKVRADLSATALGQIVFNTLNQEFIDFVRKDSMTLAQLKEKVAQQMVPLARAIAPYGALGR